MMRLAPILLLLGCATAPLPPAAPPPVAATPAPAPVLSVLRAYRAAEQQEVPAVFARDVTADFVKRVHQADHAARAAVRQLLAQDGHAAPAALARARRAVRALSAALDAMPEPPVPP